MSASADADREAELDRLNALSPSGADLQELVALAARVLGVPKVAINLISADAQHQVATYGFDPAICTRDDSMCAAVLAEPSPVVVPDAREDQRFAANPFVTGEIGEVRFYASAPLVTLRGVHIGRLCAFDEVPHPGGLLSPETLAVFADRVVDILELRARAREVERSADDLSRARADLTRANARLSLFAEQVSHDLRNPLTALLTSVELIESEPALSDDPSVGELVAAARRSGERMHALIEQIEEQARPASSTAVDEQSATVTGARDHAGRRRDHGADEGDDGQR